MPNLELQSGSWKFPAIWNISISKSDLLNNNQLMLEQKIQQQSKQVCHQTVFMGELRHRLDSVICFTPSLVTFKWYAHSMIYHDHGVNINMLISRGILGPTCLQWVAIIVMSWSPILILVFEYGVWVLREDGPSRITLAADQIVGTTCWNKEFCFKTQHFLYTFCLVCKSCWNSTGCNRKQNSNPKRCNHMD